MAPALILLPNHDILYPFYRKLLPLLKINRNIPTPLVSISIYMGGFDFQSLEIEKGIESLGIIVLTYESILPTSNLFRQSLEFAQLEVGLDKSLFLSNFKSYGSLIIDGWIKAVWRFCYFYYLELYLPHIYHP